MICRGVQDSFGETRLVLHISCKFVIVVIITITITIIVIITITIINVIIVMDYYDN